MICAVAVMTVFGCARTPASIKARDEGIEKIREGDFAGAIDSFTETIEKANVEKPEEVEALIEALYLRGDCYHNTGDEASAGADYARALQEDTAQRDFGDEAEPREITATDYLRRGMAYVNQGDYANGLACFQLGLSQEEVLCQQELLYNEAVCYEYLGDWETAKAKMEAYVSAYPDDEQAQRDWTFLKTR